MKNTILFGSFSNVRERTSRLQCNKMAVLFSASVPPRAKPEGALGVAARGGGEQGSGVWTCRPHPSDQGAHAAHAAVSVGVRSVRSGARARGHQRQQTREQAARRGHPRRHTQRPLEQGRDYPRPKRKGTKKVTNSRPVGAPNPPPSKL